MAEYKESALHEKIRNITNDYIRTLKKDEAQIISTANIKAQKFIKQLPDNININEPNSKQQTALHVAANNIFCNVATISTLIDQGINPSLIDVEGHTAWMLAMLKPRPVTEIMAFIPDNIINDIKNLPLHYALSLGKEFNHFNYELIAALIDKGADPTLSNSKDETPIQIIDNRMLELAKNKNATPALLEAAAKVKNLLYPPMVSPTSSPDRRRSRSKSLIKKGSQLIALGAKMIKERASSFSETVNAALSPRSRGASSEKNDNEKSTQNEQATSSYSQPEVESSNRETGQAIFGLQTKPINAEFGGKTPSAPTAAVSTNNSYTQLTTSMGGVSITSSNTIAKTTAEESSTSTTAPTAISPTIKTEELAVAGTVKSIKEDWEQRIKQSK